MNEEGVLALLRKRYSEKAGNGDAYAFVEQVRDKAGFDAMGTADALVMALWPSRGLLLHGFEIKTSRQDWLRELKKPIKAERFAKICDRWWLVVANKEIVKIGELPVLWGLLAVKGKRLVCEIEAKPLDPEPISRTFLAALLRAACRVGQSTPKEVRSAVAKDRLEERNRHEAEMKFERAELSRLKDQERLFEQESGVSLHQWGSSGRRTKDVARALKLVLEGQDDYQALQNRIGHISDDTQKLHERAEEIKEKYCEPASTPST